ncbi:hypothetical protein LENED_011167 [Lentinula edodes]|uniref:Uncharacterized protein n=1 Tax=Lentinula edodes TaxID=5353 RepID=A0A1Q3EPA0_LENED|nr:hypothetical protein LENED_011167 [Lentinula edodes]
MYSYAEALIKLSKPTTLTYHTGSCEVEPGIYWHWNAFSITHSTQNFSTSYFSAPAFWYAKPLTSYLHSGSTDLDPLLPGQTQLS